MAKELPYFQFEPAEYLSKDISFCSLSAQGLFMNICAYYWLRKCKITKEQVLRRLNYPKELEELIDEGVIDIKNDYLVIKFLDSQMVNATNLSKEQSRKGKLGGRPKKPNESQPKAEQNPNESHKIREDKIKQEEIRKEEIKINIEKRKLKFSSTIEPFIEIYGKELLYEFFKYWTEPNKSGTKFRQEMEKTWSLDRRLETWAKNDRSFKGNKPQLTTTADDNR